MLILDAAPFTWSEVQDSAFNKEKQVFSLYFRRMQPFTSSSMSHTEQSYSRIEKECLVICNCSQKIDPWLHGRSDNAVHAEHRPLETIEETIEKAPARLQRILMKLKRYRFNLTYKRGPTPHLADTFSRSPSTANQQE